MTPVDNITGGLVAEAEPYTPGRIDLPQIERSRIDALVAKMLGQRGDAFSKTMVTERLRQEKERLGTDPPIILRLAKGLIGRDVPDQQVRGAAILVVPDNISKAELAALEETARKSLAGQTPLVVRYPAGSGFEGIAAAVKSAVCDLGAALPAEAAQWEDPNQTPGLFDVKAFVMVPAELRAPEPFPQGPPPIRDLFEDAKAELRGLSHKKLKAVMEAHKPQLKDPPSVPLPRPLRRASSSELPKVPFFGDVLKDELALSGQIKQILGEKKISVDEKLRRLDTLCGFQGAEDPRGAERQIAKAIDYLVQYREAGAEQLQDAWNQMLLDAEAIGRVVASPTGEAADLIKALSGPEAGQGHQDPTLLARVTRALAHLVAEDVPGARALQAQWLSFVRDAVRHNIQAALGTQGALHGAGITAQLDFLASQTGDVAAVLLNADWFVMGEADLPDPPGNRKDQ